MTVAVEGAKPADVPPVRVGPNDYTVVVSGNQLRRYGLTLPTRLADCKCVAE